MHINKGEKYNEIDATKTTKTLQKGINRNINENDENWCKGSDCKYHVRLIGYGYSTVLLSMDYAPPVTKVIIENQATLMDQLKEGEIVGYEFIVKK